MADDTELEGFKSTRYFSRSWALLTKDRGWIKPVLLMTVALLVPIVGWLGVIGYIAEWARLTAWGVNAAPKQRGVRVGECIASGFRVAIVYIVWSFCIGLIAGIAAVIPLLGGLAAFAWWLFSIFLSVVVMVAMLRATIYQKIRAGLRVKTIWQMVSHDSSGLIRILGIEIVGGLIIGAICTVVAIIFFVNLLPQIFYFAAYLDQYQAILSADMQAVLALQLLGTILSALGPAFIVVYLLCGFVGMVLSMLVATAVALWMRQFDVASWGREEDPIAIAGQSADDDSYATPVTPGVPGDAAQAAAGAAAAAAVAHAAAEKDEEPVAEDAPEGVSEDEPEVVEIETVAAAPEVPAEPEPTTEPEPAAEPEVAVESEVEPTVDPEPENPSPIEDHNAERPEE